MLNNLRVYQSLFLSSDKFQLIMPKLYSMTGTANVVTGEILFLGPSSVLRIPLVHL